MSDTTAKKPSWIKRFFKYFLPWKGDRPGEVIRKIVLLVALIVFIGSAIYIADYYWTRHKSDVLYDQVATLYDRDKDTTANADPEEEPVNLPPGYNAKFADLYQINPDIKGYIEIQGTNLSFPVVQGKDNDEYLYHNIYKKYDIYGVPFLDYRCTLEQDKTSNNLLIYGHHMNGKRVFGQITNYKDLSFYQQHPIVNFDSVYEEADWKIISVFLADPEDQSFQYQNFLDMDEQTFNSYVQQVRDRSYFDADVDVQYGDQLLTLSTCSYEFTDARTVLVARKVREGETSDVNVNNAAVNSDAVYPAKYKG
ncbi:class B sortase [Clostridium facile]|uniref:Class B sortase n=1 Tax=Clostridium facile TaxID=2763035 RepID=A0ABR7IS86_9CLOT|nr:class B sortase [Clostridium facile]MBC5788005.1 class B sortase [Clostridium facile]PWM98595.1 MAG: SrtB family sortase [Massilioclostridium sp.]